MSEIPTIAQYDGKRAKVRCSLQWVISNAYSAQAEPKLPHNDIEYVFESDGGLKKNVATLLCSGDPYCRIARDIFGVKEHLRSHEDVIQILCRKGLYVLDRADSLITANDLRKMPLSLTCHMTIIDMLMLAAVSCKLAPMNSVILTVKKFAPFSASKDLPDDTAEALLLWLNKVSQKVQCLQRNAMESDKWFHKLLRHTFGQQKEEESEYPVAQNLTDDMFDGRSLALLLHYYCPNHILLQDIALKDTISQADAWHNIEISLRFCNEVLLPRSSPPQRNVISPSILHLVDLLYCGPDLKINMIAFFGMLFYYLETEPMANVVCPLGHVVAATRQPHPTVSAEWQNSETTSARRPQTLEERHQQTLCQVNQIIPGIRPLISEATKQSFSKPSETSSSASLITLGESGSYTPSQIWSKPVHVRRDKKVHSTQPLSSARHYDTFPTIHDDQNHGGLSGDASAPHPFPKPQQRPEYRNGSDLSATAPATVTNKWQARMLQDTRNTNTSNNIYGPAYGTPPHTYKGTHQQQRHPSSASTSNSTSVPTLLSNVDMSDPDVENFYRSPPSSVNLEWPGFEHIGRENDARLVNMMNDMRIETARTEDQSSRSSQSHSDVNSLAGQPKYDGYGGMYDTTYDGTSHFSNSTSSNEITSAYTSEDSSTNSTRVQRPSPRRYPDAVVDDHSPEKPTPKDQSNSGLSDMAASYPRPSQQSYTVQSRAFHNVDSARAAGYPIIDGSPDRFQPPDDLASSYASTSRSVSRRPQASSLPQNGSGDFATSVANGQATPEEQKTMTIGNTVVRLRNSSARRSRVERAAKTTSWIELAQLQKRAEEEAKAKKQRPRSVIISPKRRALIEEAKRQAAEKRNTMEDTLEKEKRKQEREWAKRLFTIRKDMLAFVEHTINDESRRQQGLKPRTRDRSRERILTGPTKAFPSHVTMGKNEETSSDYSSKSPSPSSVHQNGDRIEQEPIPQRFHEKNAVINQSGIKESDSHNYFASPLSTTYLTQGFDRSNVQLHQSYKDLNDFVPETRPTAENQKISSVATSPVRGQSNMVSHNNRTYNVSQQKQKPRNSSQVDAAVRPHVAENAASPRDRACPVPSQTSDVQTGHQSLKNLPNSPQMEPPKQSPRVVANQSPKRSQESQGKNTNPQIQVVRSSPQPETATRRSLFPGQTQAEEQEDVNPTNLTIEQGTYDSFFNLPGSNHSTPAKPSPDHNKDVLTPAKEDDDDGTEVSTMLTMMGDNVAKGGEGFELLDDLTPNTAVAKKKEQFLLRRLKKEEELKRKKADRENLAEKRREEARQKQEEAAAKKAEEKLKKQKIFEEYKKRQKQQEEAQLLQQSSVIIAGSAKKQQPGAGSRENHEQHSSRSVKPSRSGRTSPAADATPTSSKLKHPVTVPSPPSAAALTGNHTTFNVGAVASTGNHKTFNLSGGSSASNVTAKSNDADNQMTFNVMEGSDHNGNVTKPVRTRKLSSSGKKDWDAGSASSSAVSSDYAGPKLYKQPSSKSNRTIIHNAISHCCLPGKVNESLRVKTIKVLEMSDARHFMVLFRDSQCQYRSLYSYDPDSEKLHKLSGNGPINIVPNMIERLYKYNSGRKAFSPLPSKTLSVGIDAITIKNSLWQTTKKQVPAKK